MKKEELVEIEKNLQEIKKITDKESYLVSSAVNNYYIKIEPIINKELERMDMQGVEINSPSMMTIHSNNTNGMDMDSYVNDVLQTLVSEGYKIIDYNYLNNNEDVIIKYTD